MATPTSLPGLSEDETLSLQSVAENGGTIDDQLRQMIVRVCDAVLNPPPPAPKTKAKKKTKKKAS
mgnify:CR=1 FL=1